MVIRCSTTAAVAFITLVCVLPHENLPAQDTHIYDRLTSINTVSDTGPAREQIYSINDILYCTGESEAASANNAAAKLMAEGDYRAAAAALTTALPHAPLFFPFRFNLGICCIYLEDLDTARMHLTKAAYLVPEYPQTYLQIGYIYDRWGKDDIALEYYKKSLQRNPNGLSALVLIGDNYFKRNQIEMALQYYDRALQTDPKYPDALLGRAKIHFVREEYFKCVVQIKSITITGNYDKALHYYYAESAFKLKDYATAHEQYRTLLRYRTDRFFIAYSPFLIQHKIDLCARFIER